jgi:DNA-directed RNA polymerase beta subunit
MKEKILALLKALGIMKDEDITKVTAELDKLEFDKPAPVDTSNIKDAEMKKLIEGFQSQLTSFAEVNKQLTASLAAEKAARDAAVAAQQTNQKTEKEKKVTEAVDAAIKAGKYPEAKRDFLKKMFDADFDSFTEIVKDTQVDKHFKPENKEGDKDNKGEVVIKGPLDTGGGLLSKVNEFAGISNDK